MATLRRGLVDKVKKAAARVSTRSAEVAAKAGTRGARAIVETTVAAVKTVDTIQKKLGRGSSKAAKLKQAVASKAPAAPKTATAPKAPTAPAQRVISTGPASASPSLPKQPRQAAPATPIEVPLGAGRDAGRKTMPAAAAKRTKAPKPGKAPKQVFKAKRGQKHIHTGR
ncbi:hypothetical protein POL68_27155 [Stigmatella sp. ncwal1]|uniref:Uncharacterized protein n=1 Tax=Stigmatella ashevillensis TaxID=2995309 RepID=A0ABT5DGB8_9BACT|nr:hypothetical protein [Stigmatella ashevillena]MDC0712175.1 hypothetical protein [Stigmatella ashevillena]